LAYYLPPEVNFFPHPFLADPDGLLCLGSTINVENILLAYQFGIFPWNSSDEPNLWFYTHPRCVLYPDKLKIAKRMRPLLNNNKFEITFDTCFEKVIEKCKTKKRKNQDGTWITSELKEVFCKIHQKGLAHSAEVWHEGKLVGGVYGLAIGRIFFGESMFADMSNASKYGFIKLVLFLKENGFTLVDCQQKTDHLLSLGAETISKDSFSNQLKSNIFEPHLLGPWIYK